MGIQIAKTNPMSTRTKHHIKQTHASNKITAKTTIRSTSDNNYNKPGRAIRCVSQAEIVLFGGFSLMLTDGHKDGRTDTRMDGRMDGQTLI